MIGYGSKEPKVAWPNNAILALQIVINYEEGLLVSDRGRGELVKIDPDGTKTIIVDGLDSPEGIAVQGNSIFVFEGKTLEYLGKSKTSSKVNASLIVSI